ncbi:M12 family metallopeptidase [Mucilaginibacter myungsuensis]|uniref:M12 family metallopeptidase n=2 Tax=Mucilaginibacter myungsuensis TaxID=649104 RepID=A0A929PZR2_9SPHI|nr:M12 family metallopeptidase [Mucilaginibacter myungsuensis]
MAACTKDTDLVNQQLANKDKTDVVDSDTTVNVTPPVTTSPTDLDPATARAEEAYPGISGAWQSQMINGDTLRYQVISGENIFEGDILLPAGGFKANTSGDLTTQSTGNADPDSRWRNNTVYYDINDNLPNKGRVTNAIAHWEQKTSIRFVKRTTQANYVYFTGGSGCSSYVGKIGGRQPIHVGSGCSVGNTIHEIGHAIGLFHEQSRLDRADFLTIHWDQIQDGYEDNFRTWKRNGYDGFDRGTTLNFNSIMMYGPYSFAKGSKPTITKKDGSVYEYQRTALSERDINTVNFMYPN